MNNILYTPALISAVLYESASNIRIPLSVGFFIIALFIIDIIGIISKSYKNT